jgi:AraC-like DNA-binding protein
MALTPHHYHTRVRIRAAVILLHNSSNKVEYIARRTGYAGVGHFYRTFEACTTMPPRTVRELDASALEKLLRDCFEIDPWRLHEQQLKQRPGRQGAA